MDLTPKQQTSEAIRQAETILVMTGQHPSVDQAAAVVGLTMILRKFGKNVTAIISDNPSPAVNVLDTRIIDRTLGGSRDFILKLDTSKVQVETMRAEPTDRTLNIILTPKAGSFAPSDVTFDYGEANMNYDLAIILGVPTRARIDRVYEQNAEFFATIPAINLDFHRSNENYGAVNLIEPNASSLCEMLVALSESLQGGIIDADIATALLMGIVASTDRFTAAHTSPKSLTVAAQMMAAGAKQQTVVRALYRDGRPERSAERTPERRPERTNDRPAAAPARTPQASAPQPRPQAESAPRPERQENRTEPRPEPRPENRPEPRTEARPEPRKEEPSDLPIIQPGHIELSEPDAPQAKSDESAQETTSRPMMHPMADFAAASEMFRRAPEPDDKTQDPS
ncbi:MAG: hypothetical protein NVSMB39_5340 [Candidatus Saccharimonadales bacterium]